MAETTNNYPGLIPDVPGVKEGRSYRPSNGTEGDMFYHRWCDNCKADRNEDCPIIARSLAFAVGDTAYPTEWIWQKGGPVCTAFDDEALQITNQERAAQKELPL